MIFIHSPILTYNNVYIDPFSPKIEEINIKDICHSLSLLCRAGGHIATFFSVAQHSINTMLEGRARGYSPRLQLACLLHDATECYMSDITRPVKLRLPDYKTAELALMGVILQKFGVSDLSPEEWRQIGVVDDCMLELEFEKLRGIHLGASKEKPLLEHDLSERPFAAVRENFMQHFTELHRKVCNEGTQD